MADFFSDLPGWMKGAILLVALGGSNGAQFLGMTAPAQDVAVEVARDNQACRDDLKAAHKDLRDCWKECGKQ